MDLAIPIAGDAFRVWDGYYLIVAVDTYTGAMLSGRVQSARVQEDKAYEPSIDRVKRATGRKPLAVLADRGFSHARVFEWNTRLGSVPARVPKLARDRSRAAEFRSIRLAHRCGRASPGRAGGYGRQVGMLLPGWDGLGGLGRGVALPGGCGAGAGSAAGDAAAQSFELFADAEGLRVDSFGGPRARVLVAAVVAEPALAEADAEPFDDGGG